MNLLEKDIDKIYYELQELKKVLEEYGIQDIEDLQYRLDLADKYGELSEKTEIDLVILFKALINGIKAKWENQIVDLMITGNCQLELNKRRFKLKDSSEHQWFYYFKDYGVTWALTKGELEGGIKMSKEEYNKDFAYKPLTQEEYDLLKEELK